RTNAARLNGSTEIDAFVCDVDDDTAVMIITDSNLKHRDQLLPSERGFAYRMQLEALKRQGKRTDLEEVLTSAQFAQKFNSREMVAAHNAVSKDEVWRYIRLTYLIPDLLTLVDQKVLPFIAGIDLSFLDEASQQIVYDILITDQQMEIDLDKSGYLKKLYRAIGTFTKESLRDLIFQFRGTKSRVVPLINRSMLKSIVTDIELPDDETLIHLFAAFLRDTYNARGSINVVHETRKEFY
ncbi:MAG: hypothetical protein FWD03_03065, partial [Defluviitaleaceae bacterium]|nr:hypothetical protein [Defluviitaleaceae bacterium]